MKLSKWTVAISATALLATGLIVNKARSASTDSLGHSHFPIVNRVIEALGLTESQTSDIRKALQSEKTEGIELLTELRTARQNLRTAIRQPDASEADIRAASARVAEVEANLAVMRARLNHQIQPILTEEQKTKIQTFEDKVESFVDKRMAEAADSGI